jgi:hypothetical protein
MNPYELQQSAPPYITDYLKKVNSILSQDNKIYTFKSYLSSLKWAGSEEFLFTLAINCNVDLKIIRVDKRLLRQTIYFEVSGKKDSVKMFSKSLESAVNEYNKDKE